MKTVAMMIKDAINRKGFSTIKECAQALGLPYELLRKVVGENHIPKDEQILIYARKLGINPLELLFTTYYQKAPSEFKEYFETNVIRELPVAINKVPVLPWEQLDESVSKLNEHLDTNVVEGYIGTNLEGKYIFSLRVKDDSMSPFFYMDEFLLIDPNVQAQTGDYIIIKDDHNNEAIFRQLRKYQQVSVLHPLNPKYEDQVLSKEMRIVGKVVRKQMDYI